jgi:O-antigen ligase
MKNRPAYGPVREAATAFLTAPRFVAALAVATVGTAVCAFALRQLIGWPGLIGILCGLVVLSALALAAGARGIEWSGLLPISLLVFVAWAGLSIFWSSYQWATLGGIAYFVAFTMLGISMALLRDTIQIVRAFGDVLRVVLAVSLALEIIAGVLLDTPVRLINLAGNLDVAGPIQGILGTRNQLGVIALIALITFVTELRTRSITRGVGIGSVVLAVLCLLLTRSPVSGGALVLVAIAAFSLYALRRMRPERRRFWQFGLLSAGLVVAVLAWIFRSAIITALSAAGELSYRLGLWRAVWQYIPANELQGWGWIGYWRPELLPFFAIDTEAARPSASALNAFLDVWFQLGLVGLFAFLVLATLALVRSWLLASHRRSTVYAWPALVLVALIACSFAESSILVEFGWLTLVVCTVKASRELSWRQAFAV